MKAKNTQWGILIFTLVMAFSLLWSALPAQTTEVVAAPYPPFQPKLADPIYNPQIAMIMGKVLSPQLTLLTGNLAGVNPVVIGGVTYSITTRNTNASSSIQKVTQYAYEYFSALGLNTSYHSWTRCGISNRNVVAEIRGQIYPGEYVLVTAHVDDMPSSGRAPGADDNASGSAGVMAIAEVFSHYRFMRSVRFILFTGEEQGLCGSAAYAADARARGDAIQGVINLDMVGYNSDSSPIVDIYTKSSAAGSVTVGELFSNVIGTYSLNLVPNLFINASLGEYSDNASFWTNAYPAFLAIEDDDDFTPYYHTAGDTLDTLDMAYFTSMVQAAAGTAAHLALPYGPVLSIQISTPVTRITGIQAVTYTLAVTNQDVISVTGLIVSDTLPVSTTLLSADGGTLTGDVVVWSGMTLTAGETLTRTLVVFVPNPISGTLVVNENYRVASTDFPMPVVGKPITVPVMIETEIFRIYLPLILRQQF